MARAPGVHIAITSMWTSHSLVISAPLQAQFIAGDLAELPLPYQFDVVSLRHITNHARREHIQRVGVVLM